MVRMVTGRWLKGRIRVMLSWFCCGLKFPLEKVKKGDEDGFGSGWIGGITVMVQI